MTVHTSVAQRAGAQLLRPRLMKRNEETRRLMKKADLITGFVLLVLSGYVIRESWLMPPSATFGPGSGFLPFWLGVLLALLAVILSDGLAPPGDREGRQSPFPGGKALFASARCWWDWRLYIVLMEVLGFLVDTFLFVAFLMGVVEREKWPMTLMVAVLTTAGSTSSSRSCWGSHCPRTCSGFSLEGRMYLGYLS